MPTFGRKYQAPKDNSWFDMVRPGANQCVDIIRSKENMCHCKGMKINEGEDDQGVTSRMSTWVMFKAAFRRAVGAIFRG